MVVYFIKLSTPRDVIKYGGFYGVFSVVIRGEYITYIMPGKKGLENLIKKYI